MQWTRIGTLPAGKYPWGDAPFSSSQWSLGPICLAVCIVLHHCTVLRHRAGGLLFTMFCCWNRRLQTSYLVYSLLSYSFCGKRCAIVPKGWQCEGSQLPTLCTGPVLHATTLHACCTHAQTAVCYYATRCICPGMVLLSVLCTSPLILAKGQAFYFGYLGEMHLACLCIEPTRGGNGSTLAPIGSSVRHTFCVYHPFNASPASA